MLSMISLRSSLQCKLCMSQGDSLAVFPLQVSSCWFKAQLVLGIPVWQKALHEQGPPGQPHGPHGPHGHLPGHPPPAHLPGGGCALHGG